MKKILLATSLALATGFGATTAVAADGTVNINGKIVDSACSISPGSETINVTLPNATPSSFGFSGGVRAGHTRFTIRLSNCTPGTYTNVTTAFAGAVDSSYPNILANNIAAPTGATNVGVRLLKTDNTPIDINGEPVVIPFINVGSMVTEMDLDFLAAYESTSPAVTVGDVSATTTFTIGYN